MNGYSRVPASYKAPPSERTTCSGRTCHLIAWGTFSFDRREGQFMIGQMRLHHGTKVELRLSVGWKQFRVVCDCGGRRSLEGAHFPAGYFDGVEGRVYAYTPPGEQIFEDPVPF